MNSTDISTLNKGKAFVSTNNIEAYSKEVLNDEIRRLIVANVQLITDKIEIKKAKINLKADRV